MVNKLGHTIIRIVVNTVLAALVIFAGVRLAGWFKASAVEPPRDKPVHLGTLVETLELSSSSHAVDISGFGTVIASRTASVRSQVGGEIVWMHEALAIGGRLEAGETLVKIDPKDYRLAIKELETAVAQARAQLELERGREKVAAREWALMQAQAEGALGELGAGYEGLATREPQIKSAQAQVEAAKSRLSRAKLELGRTSLDVPFDAVVQQESVELGDLVTQQTSLATLVGTDTFWVQVSVPVEALARIAVPGINAPPGQGSQATVVLDDAQGLEVSRPGQVLRLLSDLDPQGRMARLLVSIERPLEVAPGGLPILLGAYVRVDIHTAAPVTGIEVPRKAVREGDLVYVYDDGALRIRTIEPLWRTEDSLIVGAGLEPGEHLITSPIPAPLEGMKLRTRERTAAAAVEVSAP